MPFKLCNLRIRFENCANASVGNLAKLMENTRHKWMRKAYGVNDTKTVKRITRKRSSNLT